MKTNYVTPHVEVIEIELEGVLCGSNGSSTTDKVDPPVIKDGGNAWSTNSEIWG